MGHIEFLNQPLQIKDVILQRQVTQKCSIYSGHLTFTSLVLVQLCGEALLLLYLCLSESTRIILERKRIGTVLFSVLALISPFTICVLISNDENGIQTDDSRDNKRHPVPSMG